MHKKILLLLLAFVIVFDFTGCVSMSAQARRERAYRHYVAKQMKQRQKAIAKAQKAANRDMKRKMKNVQPSEPKITSGVENTSYESVFTPVEPTALEPSAPEPAPKPAFKETTVDPITVSASDAISASQSPDQPSRP